MICDYLFANVAWTLFTIARFFLTKDSAPLVHVESVADYMRFSDVMAGQACFPLLMIFIFYLSGYYNRSAVFSRSRLQELLTTLFSSFITAILIYFIILINDNFTERNRNYELIAAMWSIIFSAIYIPRLAISHGITRKIRKGSIRFNTIVIGIDKSALELAESLRRTEHAKGYHIIGVIPFDNEKPGTAGIAFPTYSMDEIDRLSADYGLDAIIIAPHRRSNKEILSVVNRLFRYNIPIKIAPEMYDILTSNVRHAGVIGEAFVNIAQSNMPEWQKNVKLTFDVTASILALIVLSPAFLIIAALIKTDSKGSVFYRQERIGRRGKTFNIYKFRTMAADAEGDGIPRLTSDRDNRITRIGRFLRKYRIDETPQFWNVVKGDMSIVGPRPERKFFADKIIEKAPYYTLTYQIRPGITSWGMVRFGYAKTVDEMIERSKYDLLYLENMSLFVDMRIIIYTIKTVLTGKGM